MTEIKLTRLAPGAYIYKAEHAGGGTREYIVNRNAEDSTRWDVQCIVDGWIVDWQECTWAGLADVREMILCDLTEKA